jgi:phospholipid/cholesterol/gamma-HCH transport system substrate-binding protein
MQSAWKVGLFVVSFVALIVLGYTLVGSSLFEKPGDVYYAEFSDASNIQPGAIVTMAGVKVGKVDEVTLKGPGAAQMTLSLEPGTFVPADAMLLIPTSLLSIGEQRVDIISARGVEAGRMELGGTLRGMKAGLLQTLLPEGDRTLAALNDNLEAIRDLLGDEGLRSRLDTLLATTDATIKQVGLLMNDARGLIAENRSTLRNALVNASLAVEDMRRGISVVTELVGDPAMREEITLMVSTLAQTAQKADQMVGELSALVSDPSLRAAIDTTLKNVEDITRTGTKIAENAEKITADGAVVSHKAIALADSAQQIADEAKKLLAKVSDFVDRLPQDLKLPSPTISLETGRNVSAGAFRTDVSVKYPLTPDSFVYGAVYDATETNRITLQYGTSLRYGDLRGGIFASKPGVGVDWRVLPGFSLSGDLFDPNNPQFDVRARVGLGNEWYTYFGVMDLFGRNQALVGLGVRR